MKSIISTNLSRWKRYGFPPEIYFSHPEFARFLLTSPLGSQMKVTSDPICIVDGEPAILVEGEWMRFSGLKKTFTAQYSRRYRQKFILKRESGEVFTYLGGGQGLVSHHPYKSHLALKKVSKEEYTHLRSLAKKFNGKEEKAILQVVTTSGKGKHPFISARHIYLRIIDGERNLHAVGFGYDDPVRIPLKSGKGLLRSPDFWEYKRAKKRVITNIPISQGVVERLLQFINQSLESEAYAYHVLHHNCSTFVNAAIHYALGLNIPTSVKLKDFLLSFIPKCLALPGKILMGIFGTVGSALIGLGTLLLGEGLGQSGRKFSMPRKKERFMSPVSKIDYWTDFSSLSWQDPLATMEWQLNQPSTVVQAQ